MTLTKTVRRCKCDAYGGVAARREITRQYYAECIPPAAIHLHLDGEGFNSIDRSRKRRTSMGGLWAKAGARAMRLLGRRWKERVGLFLVLNQLGTPDLTCSTSLQAQPQLRPLRPAKGGGGQFRAILGQAHFAARDVEHLRNLVGENALAAHPEPKRGSLSLPPRMARMRFKTFSFFPGTFRSSHCSKIGATVRGKRRISGARPTRRRRLWPRPGRTGFRDRSGPG